MDAHRGDGQSSLQAFLAQVFMSLEDPNKPPMLTFDDCRLKLETIFEEQYQPERDFLDYLNVKKNRRFEDFVEGDSKSHGNGDSMKKRNPPGGDDQDLMPMDLDEDHNMPVGSSAGYGQQKDGPKKHKQEEEKQSFANDHNMTYFDKCKQMGRVGPVETKLDKKSANGEIIFSGKDDLDIEAMSSFSSIRATTGVFKGRFYFEVMLKSSGLM